VATLAGIHRQAEANSILNIGGVSFGYGSSESVSWWQPLLTPQSHDRVHERSSPRWPVPGDRRDHQQHNRRAHQRDRVGGLRPNSRLETKRSPAHATATPIATPLVTSIRISRSTSQSTLERPPQRHADTDFTSPSGDDIRHNAVDPNTGEEQGQQAKEHGKLRHQSLIRNRPPTCSSSVVTCEIGRL